MKIIFEGTEAEFINALHSFGVPNEVVFDDGSQFICGDMCGREHRRKKVERTFKELKEQDKRKAEIIRQFRNHLDAAFSTQHDIFR